MGDWGPVAALTERDPTDAETALLNAYCRDIAAALRAPGMVLDRDPDAIAEHLDLPAVALQNHVLMPAEYRRGGDARLARAVSGVSCVSWALVAERLAYGDTGMVLASPGPSLSSAAVRALADDAQQAWFYGRLAERPTWTFFGLTEPGKGSAAAELETTLTPAPDGVGWLLTGEKTYIGNGARAQLGVVLCRRAPGPWGIEAVLVDTADAGWHAELLPLVGLRGSRISRIRLDGMYIPPDRLLGAGRPRSRRGLHGALRTLLWFRPSVAALAVGVTHAVCDYVLEHRPRLGGGDRARLDDLIDRSMRVRRLVYAAAAEVDAGAANAHRIGATKMSAARLAEEATLLAADLLGPASLREHPWLEKTYRDVRAFEFMEGTGNIHRRGVFQGLLRGNFFPADGPADDPADGSAEDSAAGSASGSAEGSATPGRAD
ncbi:acyl-CoA dehydrogenase family protein [Micromonospora yangpuensis]|uniref:Acyl-CoA dehydrogenase n=1 Tax=Micromonospora yangpuensis TaxID=683228 RepID=A0A1C6UF52_9ACTN|nr:acyl-CoA dehydrogenase [Micromonospora yangpuensis]GGM05862.1 acyl-CoA dehydrogenase [Micromonospora yangpuensis]SCL52666.1 Acyl-CoA dehydrogenase [Micromonospora yangpuensis]